MHEVRELRKPLLAWRSDLPELRKLAAPALLAIIGAMTAATALVILMSTHLEGCAGSALR
jgi:hypothetical protein